MRAIIMPIFSTPPLRFIIYFGFLPGRKDDYSGGRLPAELAGERASAPSLDEDARAHSIHIRRCMQISYYFLTAAPRPGIDIDDDILPRTSQQPRRRIG